MKLSLVRQYFSFLSFAVCLLGSINKTAIAIPESELFQRIIPEINSVCDRTTELNYHSPKLRSLDGKTTVFFDVTLRHLKTEEKFDNTCLFSTEETPVINLVISNNHETKIIKINSEKNDYYSLIQPLSLSADGQYLLVEEMKPYKNSGVVTIIYALDLNQFNYQIIKTQNMCVETQKYKHNSYTDYVEFRGFAFANQAVFYCSGLASNGWIEVYDFDQNFAYRMPASTTYDQTKNYGYIIAPLEIVKKQHFD